MPAEFTPRKWVRKKHDDAYFEQLIENSARAAEAVAGNAAQRLHQINLELADLDRAIREYQPKAHGAIVMQRGNCNTNGETGCLGCPHVRWMQWADPHKTTEGRRRTAWVGHVIKHPLRKLRKTGDFADSHEITSALIREAQSLLAEKTRLVKHLSNLSRSLACTLAASRLAQADEAPPESCSTG